MQDGTGSLAILLCVTGVVLVLLLVVCLNNSIVIRDIVVLLNADLHNIKQKQKIMVIMISRDIRG